MAVAVAFLVRRRLAGEHTSAPDLGAYPPEVVGYLTGGRANATDAVLASLHARGALDVVPGSRPVLTGSVRLPADATALERAAYARASGSTVKWARQHVRQLPEMDDLEADLIRRGLIVDNGTRGRARLVTALG